MREIKFRGLSKHNGWVHGFYWTAISNDSYIKLANGVDYEVDSKTVGQFTGLLDKNGKEIYEGDVLKDDVGDLLEVKFGQLPLDKSGDCVCTYPAFYCKNFGHLGSVPFHECQEIGGWMEVIGNIYENPELLK